MSMTGTDNQTGQHLDGLGHLKQSIVDILTTPIGTRVMRRDYGSRLFALIDAPMNSMTIVAIVAATAEALATWEPRIVVERVVVTDASASGRVSLSVYGTYRPDGKAIVLDGILL
jgi:hypothetical protein